MGPALAETLSSAECVWSVCQCHHGPQHRHSGGRSDSRQGGEYSVCLTSSFAAILGSEYCSGYIDKGKRSLLITINNVGQHSDGKWNTGFYCPDSQESGSVHCCGSVQDKYCCTSPPEAGLGPGENISLLMLGVAAALLAVVMIICVCRPFWSSHFTRSKHGEDLANCLPGLTLVLLCHSGSGCGQDKPKKNVSNIQIAESGHYNTEHFSSYLNSDAGYGSQLGEINKGKYVNPVKVL